MLFFKKLAVLVAVWLMVMPLVCLAQGPAGAPSRIKYNFNPGWKLFVGDTAGAEAINFDDRGWKEISLPHAFNEDDAFKKAIQDLSTGIAWYRKRFQVHGGTVAAGITQDRKVFLEFEGIRQ